MKLDNYGPSLNGTPHRKRIYDWTLRRYRWMAVVDLGRAFSIAQPASKYDNPDLGKTARKVRADPNFERVYGWLQHNGPAYAKDIAAAIRVERSTVDTIIARHPEQFRHELTPVLQKNGGQRTVKLWEVVEE